MQCGNCIFRDLICFWKKEKITVQRTWGDYILCRIYRFFLCPLFPMHKEQTAHLERPSRSETVGMQMSCFSLQLRVNYQACAIRDLIGVCLTFLCCSRRLEEHWRRQPPPVIWVWHSLISLTLTTQRDWPQRTINPPLTWIALEKNVKKFFFDVVFVFLNRK